jgi:hypothetical protein
LRPSSFQQLPINLYKTTLNEQVGSFTQYRVFPTFVHVSNLPISDYEAAGVDTIVNAVQPTTLTHTISAYYYESVFTYNGFEFKFMYNHNKKLLYKKNLLRHQVFSFKTKYESFVHSYEVDSNGNVFIDADINDIVEINIPSDNFEILSKVPTYPNKHYFSIDDIEYVFPFVNWTSAIKSYLPDMGGSIL